MIATGTDIKCLECLLFMRDVRSKNYYEQMKGRGTRVIDLEEFKKVSPSAKNNKDHFVLFDAVGVTKSPKTSGRTLDRLPSESTKNLLMKAALGNRDEDTLTTLAGRITRLDKIMTPEEKTEFENISGGLTAKNIVENMLNAFDEDYLKEKTIEKHGVDNVTKEKYDEVQKRLIDNACDPLCNAALRNYIIKIKQVHEQIIDDVNIDSVTFSGWSQNYTNDILKTIKDFRQFIDEHKDEIEALSIIYNQKYKNRKLTEKMIRDLYNVICKPPYNFTIEKMWNCYYVRDNGKFDKPIEYQLMDIISIIKYELGQINTLTPFSTSVKLKFKEWMFKRNSTQGYIFTNEQVSWLQMIRDHICMSLSIEDDDLELAPFDNKGGLGKYYELFGAQYLNIMNELNVALIA